MGGQYGVKESSEGAIALLKIGTEIKVLLKDGAQLKDASDLAKALTQPGPLKDVVDAGLKDISLATKELKELDAQDVLQLMTNVGPSVLEFVKA